MSGAFLQWPAGKLYFDVVKSENHEATAEITEHNVEEGFKPTDHIRQNPDRITITGFMSNAPIAVQGETTKPDHGGTYKSLNLDVPEFKAPIAPTPGALFGAIGGAIASILGKKKQYSVNAIQFSNLFNAPSDTYVKLRELQKAGTQIKVLTAIFDYENMVIESVTVPREKADGTGATFTIVLRQIRIVQTKTVNAPIPTEARGKKEVAKGAQNPSDDNNAQKKSILKFIQNKFSGKSSLPSVPGF